MTPDEILEGNKLVAVFMGYTYFGHNDPRLPEGAESGWKTDAKASNFTKINRLAGNKYLCRNHNQLVYHRDWNWMMEVVDRIDGMDLGPGNFYDISINEDYTDVCKWDDDSKMRQISTGEGETRKQNTFKAIVDFIKIYNNDQVQSTE